MPSHLLPFARRALLLALLVPAVPPAFSQAPADGAAAPAGTAASRPLTKSAAPGPLPAAPSSAAQASYLLGLTLGNQLEHNGLAGTLVLKQLTRGLKDGLAGAPVSNAQRAEATQFMRAARDTLAERNRVQAQAFLAGNAAQAGVRKTASGLQYRVLAEGAPGGHAPRMSEQVTVRYRASLLDGTVFDSSEAHAEPATFRMNSMLKGWQEALLMMQPGAKWQLWLPPELAYDRFPPPGIAPGALIVYELELVKVEAPPPPDMRGTRPRAAPRSDSSPPPAANAAKH